MKANGTFVGSKLGQPKGSFILKTLLSAYCVAVAFGAASVAHATDATPVELVFKNNTGVSSSQIYIQFLGGGSVGGTYNDTLLGNNIQLQANKSYSLDQLGGSTVDLSQFSGRVYVNYGAYGMAALGTNGGSYTPSAGNPLDPNYNTRYQYFEATIQPQANNSVTYYGDLSYIDFTAMSMSMSAINKSTGKVNPAISNSNQISANTQVLVNATKATATNPSYAVLPSGASTALPNTSFTRVISPQFSQQTPGHETYHQFDNYLANLNGKSVTLAGTFVGTGQQPTGIKATQAQTYYFTGTFGANGAITLTAKQNISGFSNVSWINNNPTNLGVGDSVTIEIAAGALNSQEGIYGNNVVYTVTGNGPTYTTTGITNDVFGRAVGDLLAGLSFGYVGSTKTVTFQGNTVALGDMASSDWWASGEAQGTAPTYVPNATLTGGKITATTVQWTDTPASQGVYFAGAQPNNADYYNGYAASLSTLTTGYGFPLQDRLGNNLLSYNTVTTPNTQIVLTLNPDGTSAIPTSIWTGSASSSSFSDASNWSNNTVPTGAASAQFLGASSTGAYAINVSSPISVGGIDFNYAAGTFTLSGSAISLTGDIVNSSSHTQTINNDLSLGSDSLVVAANSDLVLGGNMALSNGATANTMTVTGNEDTTISGLISDGTTAGGSVVKSGTGTLTLNGANTFTGGLDHQSGTLILGNNSAAGTGTLTLGSAPASSTTSSPLTVLQAGTSALTLGNAVAIAGDVTISGSNGITFTGNTTLTAASPTTPTAFTVTNTVNAPVEFSGAIGENGAGMGFIKAGAGTMTFSGSSANTFTGNLTVNEGTLILNKTGVAAYGSNLVVGDNAGLPNSAVVQLAANNQIPANRTITVNTDGKFDMQSYDASATNLYMTGGSVTGTGTLTLTGGGTGTGFQFSGIDSASATISTNLELSGQQTFGVTKTSSTGPQVTISGNITGNNTSLTKTGAGTLALTGTHTLTGTTTITVAGGILETTSIANATVNLNGGALGSTTSGTVASPIAFTNLYSSNGALLLGLGASNTSDEIHVSGTTNLALAAGTNSTFLFKNDGFTSGNGTFTLITGNVTGTTGLTFASIDIHGLTGSFSVVGGNLVFTGQAGVTDTWTGGAGSGSWQQAGNWQSGTVPLFGADLVFTGSTQTNVTPAGNWTTGAITFDSNAAAFNIGGNIITLGGDLTNNSANVQTIGSALALNADRTINSATTTGSLVLTGTLALSNTAALANTLTVTGDGNTSIIGTISDGPATGGSIIKTGTGTLTLQGTNTFTGTFTVGEGTVSITSAAALGDQSASNTLIFDGGTVQTTASTTFTNLRGIEMRSTGIFDTDGQAVTLTGKIYGLGGLTKNGAGSLTLNLTGDPTTNSNTYVGTTTVNEGSLILGYSGALGVKSSTVVNSGGSVVLGGGFDVTGYGLTISGSGDGGNGALHLTAGIANWGGLITLGGSASIQADSSSTLGLTNTIAVGANTLTLTGTGTTPTINVSGGITGTGGVTIASTGIVNLSGENSGFSGLFTVQTGTLAVSQATSLGGGTASVAVNSDAILDFANTTDTTFNLSTINLNGIGAGITVNGSGAITTTGSATAFVNGNITLAGATTIGSSTGQLVLNGNIDNGGFDLTTNNISTQMILSGAISGAGGITTAGTSSVLLNGANTYTGATSIITGTELDVSNSAGLGGTTGGTTVANGGTLGLQGGISIGAEALSLSGTGVNASGALNNISGNNTYGGAINIAAGTAIQSTSGKLTLSGALTASGAFQTQGNGTVYFSGNSPSFASGTTLTIASGTLAAVDLTNVTLNVGTNTAVAAGVAAPTFSPGDVNNITSVTVAGFNPGVGAQLLMDLGASTSDEIISGTAPNITNTLLFNFNNAGITSGGTYALIETSSGQFNTSNLNNLQFQSNINGLSGTFSLTNTDTTLVFTASLTAAEWTNAGGTGLWGDDNNWTGGTSPASGSAVAFTSASSAIIDTQMDRLAGGIEFESGSAALTVANHTVNIYGDIVNHSSNVQTISSALNVVGNASMNAASANLSVGGPVNFGSTHTLTVTGSHDTTISGAITSSSGATGNLVKTGTGNLKLTGNSTFNGTTAVNAGTLILDGTTGAGNAIAIGHDGTFAGTGTAYGNVTVAGTLAPGHSPGTLTTGSEQWLAGGNYNWQIADALGVAGIGYDLMHLNGSLDLTQLGVGEFSINLWSLSGVSPDVNGAALNFDNSVNQSWTLVSTTGGIAGFDASQFIVNTDPMNGTAGFVNPYTGAFSVDVNGNNLILEYQVISAPEPSTWQFLIVSAIGLALLVRRNRSRKNLASIDQ